MPKFTGSPSKNLGRGGRLWENARKKCLANSQICWICSGECPDFSWDKIPFDSAAIDLTLKWPHPASASVDHIITVKKLAPNDPLLWSQSNLRPAHLRCNSARGDGERQTGRAATKTSRNWVA